MHLVRGLVLGAIYLSVVSCNNNVCVEWFSRKPNCCLAISEFDSV